MGHATKAGRSAMEGKKTLAYMLRAIKAGRDIDELAERYGRTQAEIAKYLKNRGYSITGKKLPPANGSDRPLVESAGGSAQYVAASNHLPIPLQPVPHRERNHPTGLDWGTVSPVADSNESPDEMYRRRRIQRDRMRRSVQRSPGGGRGGPAPKFTPEQDAEIRQRYEKGETQRALGRAYGASDATVRRAIERAGGKTLGRSGRWRWRTVAASNEEAQAS